MTDIILGTTPSQIAVTLQLEELLATRLLVQGNSGSGKSHLLRRLIEQSAPFVQQIILDPEGDYLQLAERFGHVVINALDYSVKGIEEIGARVRQHRYSAVLTLEHLPDIDAQMRQAAAFLRGLFEVDRAHWHAALVFVDEAQIFAPSGTDGSDESRKATLSAMVNLMCRGRKRGLCGVIATQRLAKLAKNVAAECANFLMGRTLLDIDMARAADLLGIEKKKAEIFRDLTPGRFIGLGSAIARRPIEICIGPVETSGRGATPDLLPPPLTPAGSADEILFAAPTAAPPRPVIRPTAPPQPSAPPLDGPKPPPRRPPVAVDMDSFDRQILALANEEAHRFQPVTELYQLFLQQCRLQGLNGRECDPAQFRRKIAAARAGMLPAPEADAAWQEICSSADLLGDEERAVFLHLAWAARESQRCPPDSALAAILGSRSARRGRAILGHIERSGWLVVREDLTGRRMIAIPAAGWETEAGDASL